MADFFFGSSSVTVASQAGVFSLLYVITIVPCWVAVFFIFKNIKKKRSRSVMAWSVILFILLALPYLYIVANNKYFPWQLIAAILLVPVYSFISFFWKTEDEERSVFWSLYARVYDFLLRFHPYKKLVNEIVAEVSSDSKAGTVLDVGCGTGNIVIGLLGEGDYQITAVDSSPQMLKRLKVKLARANKNCNCIKLNIDDEISTLNKQFDMVVVNNVLYTLSDPNVALKNIFHLIKPGGRIHISEPLVDSSINKLLKSHFKETGFLRALGESFVYAVPMLMVLFFNGLISLSAARKKMNFFEEKGLTETIKSLGFKDVEVRRVYAEQNVFIKAIKP